LCVWQLYDGHCLWRATPYDRWSCLDSPAIFCPYRKRAWFVHHFAIFTRHLGFGHFVQHGFGHPSSTGFGHSVQLLHRLDSPAIFCPYSKRAWFVHHFVILSLGTSASATPFNSASANLSSATDTRLQLEASFAAKLDNIVADITNLVDNLRKVGSIPTPPVTKVQSDAIRYLTGRLHNIPTLIRLFNLVLVNDLITSLFVVEATSMSDDELLASCTLPFISEWAERALTSHMEVLLGEAGIPLVHHSPFQQFAALIVAQNLPLDSFLPTFLAGRVDYDHGPCFKNPSRHFQQRDVTLLLRMGSRWN
jgi:hypothetical protein